MSELSELDAAQLVVTADCIGDYPEPYAWTEETIDPANMRKVSPAPARGVTLPSLPDLYPGRAYYVANSLEAELRDFNFLYPRRSKATDGWLGDASHSARKSDHNPDYDSGGVIRAGDLTTTSLTEAQDRALIADMIATEKANRVDRLWYIIHRFPGDSTTYIWSRTNNWARKPYALGRQMPHEKHFHTSIMHTNAAARDTSPWFSKAIAAKLADGEDQPITPTARPLISLRAVQAAIKSGAGLTVGEDGKQYQTMLNRFNPDYVLVTDGVLGPKSRRATALAQLIVAQRNGNTTLDRGDCWPGGDHPDLDGLPGAELFRALGVNNSDT